MRSLTVWLTLASLLAAQQPPPAKSPEPQGQFTLSVTTNLVVVNVGVRDRSGAIVQGLKAADFEVLEDGRAQTIAVFEFQRLDQQAEQKAAEEAALAAKAEAATAAEPTAGTPAPPGQVRFKDRRLLVLFFDFAGMPVPDQIRTQESAVKFLDTQMSPLDVVSIMSFSSKLTVHQEFTSDREQLKKVVQGFRVGEGTDLAADAVEAAEEDEEDAAFIPDESEFNVFNTDRKLSALEDAVKGLASMPEKKALVYFSSGVSKNGMENYAQVRSTVNAAVRANVAFYPVDSRGLMASAPAGDASQSSPRGTAVYSGQSQRAQRDKANETQETLDTLASDTGGKALLDTNDLSLGIQQAQKDLASYYILGYYSSNAARDGKFRKITVRLRQGVQQAKLDYRSGYYAAKEFRQFTAYDKEKQLEEALALGDPVTEVPLAVEANYFRLNKDRYFVPVAVKIPGALVDPQRPDLDFIGQVRDSKGRLVGSVRDGIKVRLKKEELTQLANRPITYDTGFVLPAGSYRLKCLTRENGGGRMGTFETPFEIPDLHGESKALRLSSVVLANQRVALQSAVAAAEKDKKILNKHPLVSDGQKLLPSVTRVFRRDQNLYVYVEAYDPGTQPATSVVASVSFFRGGRKALETAPVRAYATSRPGTVPLRVQVPLEKLKAGRYVCQVSVIDQAGQKFGVARASIAILP